MNLPNRLTCSRFLLTVGFVVVLSTKWRFANCVGLVLFALAGVTDYLDGSLARSRNLVTDFGKLMDPLADKIMQRRRSPNSKVLSLRFVHHSVDHYIEQLEAMAQLIS